MTEVVYLDQNKWIPLLQQKKGLIPGYAKELEAVEELSESGTAIFPLTHLTLKETASYSGGRERVEEMIDFMMNISNRYFFPPADIVRMEEVSQEAHRLLGLEFSMNDKILGQGPLFMYGGARSTIEANGGENDEEIEKQLNEWAKSEEGMRDLVFREDVLEIIGDRSDEEELAEDLEEIRKENEGKFSSNSQQRRITTLYYWKKTILPDLQQELTRLLLSNLTTVDPLFDHGISEKKLRSEEYALRYIQHFPYADTYTTLTVSRDLEKKKIEPNDKNDIMTLSIAIPYSDLVITENFWASVASKTNLDTRYNTKVRSDLSSVLEIGD